MRFQCSFGKRRYVTRWLKSSSRQATGGGLDCELAMAVSRSGRCLLGALAALVAVATEERCHLGLQCCLEQETRAEAHDLLQGVSQVSDVTALVEQAVDLSTKLLGR